MVNPELWYPERYCERYGQQWCTDPYDGPPHYPALPYILVVDLATPRLRRRRRKFWTAALNAALDSWEPSGLQLDGTRDASFAYAFGTITVDLTDTPDGTAGYAAFGITPEDAVRWPEAPHEAPLPGVGWAHVDPVEFEKIFKSKVSRSLEAIIAHEVGHTFGFGHGPSRNCMDTDTVHNTRPTAEEIKALKDYFNV